MTTEFNYGSLTKDFEDGFYLIQVTEHGETELTIAEYMCDLDSWQQIVADYDVWQYSHPHAEKIEVICYLQIRS